MFNILKNKLKSVFGYNKKSVRLSYREKAVAAITPGSLISGSSMDRQHGIDHAFKFAEGSSLLDVGCHDGEIPLAFASQGVNFIDGVDLSPACIHSARDSFRCSSVDSNFQVCDLALGVDELKRQVRKSKYDIVCYLGVHHHLSNQMPLNMLDELESCLFAMCQKVLLVRCPATYFVELEPKIISSSFKLYKGPIKGPVGDLFVFQRKH
ncbi:MAG: class I SAM-dependent methyltransferase [Cyanobacteria bacterium M_surface_10_m2_179]|nr:class I SAM-dependent methyltransferase [Cyanobacteria bacterium M_surface_10_m2_179]